MCVCEETGHRKIQQTVWLKYQLLFMAKLNVVPISELHSNVLSNTKVICITLLSLSLSFNSNYLLS